MTEKKIGTQIQIPKLRNGEFGCYMQICSKNVYKQSFPAAHHFDDFEGPNWEVFRPVRRFIISVLRYQIHQEKKISITF